MAATLNGTPVEVIWAAGADPAGQTINIPANTTAVYMMWAYYAGGATGHGLASSTLAGNSPAQVFEYPTGSGDTTATGVAAWYNPPTGNQTLDVAWDAAPAEGPTCMVWFVKDGNTSAWRDADASGGSGSAAVSVTLTTVSGDLVLKMDQRYGSAPGTSSGWTSALTGENNQESFRGSNISASGSSTTAACEGPNYSSVAAVAIPPTGGSTVTGSGAITLDPLTVAGAGVRTSKGTGALALEVLQVSGAGVRHAVGSGALTLLPVEVAGEGTVGAVVTGTGAITLEPLTVAGAGVRISKGAGALTLEALQVSGAGVRTSKGSGAIVLDLLQVSGAGVRESKGSGSILFDTLQVDGAGNVFSGIGGSGALTLTPLLVSGAGVRTAKGTGAITLPGLEVAGSGTVETPTEGSGALTLLPVEAAGAGVRTAKGTGAIVLPMFQVSGYDVPPTPGGAYQYIGGTAFDAQGRMLTSLLDVEEPVPAGAHYLDGVAHDAAGQRYVTTWPGSAAVKFLDGFAMRADGVQVVAPDAVPARALCGIGVTARGETAVTEEAPSIAVEGFGLDPAGRLSVTRKPPAV